MPLLQAYNAEKAGAKAIIVTDYKDERLLTMAAPEDRPEIAKLKDDITIPTALVQLVRDPGLFLSTAQTCRPLLSLLRKAPAAERLAVDITELRSAMHNRQAAICQEVLGNAGRWKSWGL